MKKQEIFESFQLAKSGKFAKMNDSFWFRFWLLLLITTTTSTLDQASFYGSSSVSIPLREAKSSTDIHFKFRTHLPNALILLVAGQIDHCIIALVNGKLKVNINLGAGESELVSKQHPKLNDFQWHEVFIIRKEGDLSMIIDNLYKFRMHLAGDFFELNIHYGLFLGGQGNRTDLFYGHMDNFRGCLSEVMYNGILVLDQARHRQSQAAVHGVTWNCAAEFDSAVNQEISFIEDGAFMTVSQNVQHGLKLQFEFKTLVEHAILIYNSGPVSKPDVFSVEVWKNQLRVMFKHSDKIHEVLADWPVADGHWHKISLKLAGSFELNLDGRSKQVRLPRGHFMDFADVFYIGGIEASKRTRAMAKGVKTADVSFRGCLRHLIIYDKPKGLPDVHISEGLVPGCAYQFNLTEPGLDRTRVSSTDLDILSLTPLDVLEGQSTLLTPNNLHVVLDYHKFGIRDIGIQFTLVEPPAHGSLSIDVWPNNVFTLADVARDKVHYIHDGSETSEDHFDLEVVFIPAELFLLPAYLQGKFRFRCLVNVTMVNDPPKLVIAPINVLRVPQGARLILPADLLVVVDPDSSPRNLIFSILDPGPGHFEYIHKSTPIGSFTLDDLERKAVVYAHHASGANESYVTLQVSDGIETSQPGKIRVSAFPQFWRLQNNTGVVLMHLTSAMITPFNLSFVSNVANATESAQYVIEQGPKFGVMEVEKDLGRWENTVIFNSDDIRQHKVRYRHVTARPEVDEFQFRTTLNKTLYTFRMTFAKCHFIEVNRTRVELRHSVEGVINLTNLQYKTYPVESPFTSIRYQIQRGPKFGFLYSAVSNYKMRFGDLFTQEDLALGNLKYRLYRKAYSVINDHIGLIVSAPGCSNVTANFSVDYLPEQEALNSLKGKFTLHRLQVQEGGTTEILSTDLALLPGFDLIFNITTMPLHGFLQVPERNNTNYFTLQELNREQLTYQHDDSESRHDSFVFMALSKEDHDFEFVATVNFDVLLKNDNSPTRVIDKTFNVVVGSERLLTSSDLNYGDVDLDTKPSDIVYTFKVQELPNGEFLNTQTRAKITEFTQEDLNQQHILFKHRGPEYGKIKFWVTDGPYYVSGILEVQASAPFIRPVMRERLVVQHGRSAVLKVEHLTYNTNLFANDEDVVYEVVTKPSYGQMINEDGTIILEFTQKQLNAGRISYKNDIATSNADEVHLKVKCRDASNTAQLGVLMLPGSYWQPLHIKAMTSLTVEESTSALISPRHIEIVQPQVPSSSIIYHITTPPENGYISILPRGTIHNEDQYSIVRSFTQAMINANRVIYIQSVANETLDRVTFNVSNGMVNLNGLVLDIEIIPERLYLGSNILNVNEGGTSIINVVHLYVATQYYKSRVTDYVILEEPAYGCIQVQRRCSKLHGFSQKELSNGMVQYAHNGSENLHDSLVLIAVAGEKRSIPVVLNIKVIPINDQKPRLINNTGLTMWEGGVAVISNEMLAVVDEDRPQETLKFQVLSSWWGNVSLASEGSKLKFFTQELINRGMVVFRHWNGTEGRFSFNISDGLHSTKEFTFHIRTRPVQLDLVHHRPLHIFPLQRKYITSSHLLAVVSDPDREVTYQVTTGPSLGRLMTESSTPGVFEVVLHFTQQDLNNSRIYYEHTHPFAGLYANDSFVFDVKSHLADGLYRQQMKIDISVSSGGLDAYVIIPQLTVDEGGMVNVILNFSGVVVFLENHAHLRAPIIHASVNQPQHGLVFLQDNRQNLSTFTQQQLESGQVKYQHDHSDSLGDNLFFSLYFLPGYIMLCNLTVPIVVRPINDQPFKLVTPAPHFTVVQGENHTISKLELCTEDIDTSPADLSYDIISGPQEGRLILTPQGAVNHFTQADVDKNLLLYVHTHNTSTLTDTFHLRVWDGKFRPEYTVFNVQVLPLSLNVSKGLPVNIQQGMNVVLLSSKQFIVRTNANPQRVQYRITTAPRHGVLFVRDASAAEFVQDDVDNDRVMYMQRDMTTANDSMMIWVGIHGGNSSFGKEVQVEVGVQPLMQIGNCTVLAGEVNKLSLHVLDATPLAKLTNSNPRYIITSQPQYGEVRKIIRSSGEQRNVLNTLVTGFTHEELQSGLIYIAIRDIEVPYAGTADRLDFILAASIFQPAVGQLKLHIRSPIHNDIYSTLAGPNDPAGHEGGLHFASPNMTRDYFLIVSMVAGVVILGVAVIVIIKCRSFEITELDKNELPLPRPPDRLITASPPLIKSDGFASPLQATLPHCKVTPLSRMDQGEAKYPYAEEHEEWSSCGTEAGAPCGGRNIMLRRNQYWV